MNINKDIKEYIEINQRENYPLFKIIAVKKNFRSGKFSPYEVEIILLSQNNDELIFLFQEAFDIKINPIDGIFEAYIDIMNISEMQIENAVYYISGNEEELFSFYCKSFIFYKKEMV